MQLHSVTPVQLIIIIKLNENSERAKHEEFQMMFCLSS